jgi:hypothetical protein
MVQIKVLGFIAVLLALTMYFSGFTGLTPKFAFADEGTKNEPLVETPKGRVADPIVFYIPSATVSYSTASGNPITNESNELTISVQSASFASKSN